jgi:tripartite-type tricarboxylate transporter receptor subunit TctC
MGAAAQPYPSRPIRIFLGQTPGNAPDFLARMVAQPLSEVLRTPVTIEYRSGASGTIAAGQVAKAPADGYTLLLGGLSNLVVAAALQAGLPYDPARDFVPIGRIAYTPFVLLATASLPVKNVADLIAYAKANPGRLTFGTYGEGSVGHVTYELLKAAADIDMIEIPYKGSASAIADLIAGRLALNRSDVAVSRQHEQMGTVRMIAALGSRRAPGATEVPTIAEQGVRGFAIDAWYGLVAPAGTPAEVVGRLVAALDEVRNTPEFRRRLDELNYDFIGDTPAEFGAAMKADTEKYVDVIRRARNGVAKEIPGRK